MILKGKYKVNNTGLANVPVLQSDGPPPIYPINFTDATGIAWVGLAFFCASKGAGELYFTSATDSWEESWDAYCTATGFEGGAVNCTTIDFGDVGQEIDDEFYIDVLAYVLVKVVEAVEGEFLSESNFAYVTNKLLDEMYTESMTKIEKLRPTMTQLLNNSSGVSSVTVNDSTKGKLSDYDIVFIVANSYSNWSPLAYAFPAKMLCSAVGTGTFPIQVAENDKYSVFNGSATGITYKSGNSGKLYQVYGLKIPTEVK